MRKLQGSLPVLLGCGVLALGIFALDINMPLGVAAAVPYVLVVLASAWSLDRRVIFLVATLCTLLTYVGFELSPEGGELWKVAANRSLAMVAVWVTAFLVYQRKGREEALRKLNEDLKGRTQQLRAANEQLMNFIDWEKSLKNEIQEKELRYRTLFNQSPDAVVLIDPETTLPVEFNEVAPQLLGYTREEFKSLRVEDYEAQESREEIRIHVEKVFRQGEDSFETKLRTKKGEIRDFLINIRIIELRGKKLFHNIFKDITERKGAENHLKFFKHVIAQTHDPIYWISPEQEFRFVYVNEAACRHYGYSEEELLQMSIPDWDQNFPLQACEEFWQELKTQRSKIFETLHRRRNGEVVPVEVTGNYVVHDGKEYIVGTIKDISERRDAEEALRLNELSIRELQELTSEAKCSFEERIQKLLQLGCRRFELPVGLVNQVRGEELEFTHVWAPDGAIQQGIRVQLESSFLEVTLLADEPIRFENATMSKWRDHLSCKRMGFESYIGAKLKGQEKLYGTLCFFGTNPRPKLFTDADVAFLELMARWLSGELDRRQAEQTLRQSEERFRVLYDDNPSMYFTVAPEGTVLSVNHFGAEQLGYHPDELIGRSVLHVFYEDDKETVTQSLASVFAQPDGIATWEFRKVKKSGEVIWVQEKVRIVPRASQEFVALIVCEDITVERLAQESVWTLESQLHQAVQASNTGLWDWNTETNEVFFSTEWKRQIGYEDHEITGHFSEWESRLHPDDHNRAIAYIHHYLANSEGEYSQEFRLRHKDGSYRWISARASFVPEIDGRCLRLLGSHIDVTAMKETESSLRKLQSQYESLVDTIDGIVWEGDPITFKFTFVSAYAERILGYPVKQWISEPTFWVDHLHPDDREWSKAFCQETSGKQSDHQFEYRMIAADGRTVWLRDVVTIVRDNQGVLRNRGIMVDITERKKVEEEVSAHLLRLQSLSELALTLSGDRIEVFEQIARMLGDLFKVNVVCLSHIRGDQLYFLAVYENGVVSRDVGQCPLYVTPCATVEKTKDLRMYDKVAERFPGAMFLQDHHAYAYCGFPAFDNEGNVVAVICLLDEGPHEFTQEDQNVLRIFGQRIGMELDLQNQQVQRKQAADELCGSEARLKEAQRIAHVGSWELDLGKKQLMWSEEGYRILEINPNEGVSSYEATLDRVHPEDRELVKRVYSNSVQNKTPFAFMHRLLMPDGRMKWVQCRCETFYDDQGNPIRSVGTTQDISDRVQAEEALRESEAQLKTLTEAIPQMLWTAKPDGALDYVSQQLLDYCGCTSEQLLEWNWADFLHPEDVPGTAEKWEKTCEAGLPYENDFRLRRADLSYRWFIARALPSKDETGKIVKWFGTCTDIMERKEAEEKLITQAQIMDQIHDAVVSTDLEGVITSWNKGAESQYGFTMEEAVGKPISMIYPENQRKFLLHDIVQPLKAKGHHEVEAIVSKKSGKRITIHLSLDVLKDEKGIATGMIGYGFDITERKRIEETLRKFEKIINCSKDLLAFVDRTMVFLAVNKRYEEIFNLPQEDLIGKHVSEIRGNAQFETVWKPVLLRGLSGESVTFEHWVNFPNDCRWYMETNIDPFYHNGQISGVVVQCRNITERHEMESLKAQYLNKVLSAQEDERARIARELHDETGQSLTALLIGLRTLDAAKSSHEMKERIKDLRSLTSSTIEEVQRLAMGLRPMVLDDLGLQVALERYCREYAKLYHVRVTSKIEIADSARLPREIETALFRILQEAFTNIAKHAVAKQIHVCVRFEDPFIRMVIKDDGSGFHMNDSGMGKGLKSQLGLHGMRQRATMVGGELTVESNLGRGTTITVGIPLRTGTLT